MIDFLAGMDILLSRNKKWLSGKRIGLVSHMAAVDSKGCPSARRFYRETRLTCIMGPEHGFSGLAGAGELCKDAIHPKWNIPVFSLYGETRKPTAAMLKNVDTIVFDVQDIGARPYTFVSTLRYVLEAASEFGKEIIVADRPIPLPRITDGPVMEDKFASFVGMIPAPMSYGMTPGETALWLRDTLGLKLDLKVAKMQGYCRQPERGADWPPFAPPSPAIVSWESATCFPATVFCEGLTSVDCGRRTCLPFQLLGARWMKGAEVSGFLSALKLPGTKFMPRRYNSRRPEMNNAILDGVWMQVTDRNSFQPIVTAVSIIHCLQELYGRNRIWNKKTTRAAWFDKLFGTDTVRLALLDCEDAKTIADRWQPGLTTYNQSRRNYVLYKAFL